MTKHKARKVAARDHSRATGRSYASSLRMLRDDSVDDVHQMRKLGFYPRAFAQAAMPAYEPESDTTKWTRHNGNIAVEITAGTTLSNGQPSNVGLPYGVVARALIAFLATKMTESGSSRIVLPLSPDAFMRTLGVRGECGDQDVEEWLCNHIERVCSARFSARWNGTKRQDSGDDGNVAIMIADSWGVDWREPDVEPFIQCTEEFHTEVIRNAIPIDLKAFRSMFRSPLCVDLYLWLGARIRHVTRSVVVPFRLLNIQMGHPVATNNEQLDEFTDRVVDHLAHILTVYPKLNVKVTPGGLRLMPSPDHIDPQP